MAGSVVMAFEEVCPDRIDLIHKNYRKLCNLLVDVEEWGQVVIISMLTRYARTQFLSPWKEVRHSKPPSKKQKPIRNPNPYSGKFTKYIYLLIDSFTFSSVSILDSRQTWWQPPAHPNYLVSFLEMQHASCPVLMRAAGRDTPATEEL